MLEKLEKGEKRDVDEDLCKIVKGTKRGPFSETFSSNERDLKGGWILSLCRFGGPQLSRSFVRQKLETKNTVTEKRNNNDTTETAFGDGSKIHSGVITH